VITLGLRQVIRRIRNSYYFSRSCPRCKRRPLFYCTFSCSW